MKQDQKICLDAGMDDIAGKPVDFERLFDMMERLVPQGAGRRGQGAGVRLQETGRRGQVAGDRLQETGRRGQVAGVRLQGTGRSPFFGAEHFKGIDIEKGLRTWQNAELYQKAILGFCRDYADAGERILAFLQNRDRDGAYRIAHAVKGVAGNLSITEVFNIAAKLSVALGKEEQTERLIPFAEALAEALKDLEGFKNLQGLTEADKECLTPDSEGEDFSVPREDIQYLKSLLQELLASFEQYNPEAAGPSLEKLDRSLSPSQTEPVRQTLSQFDFDKAREETLKLAQALGIDMSV
jgi:two-component system sensor histidine kinase EvgS